jgi:hypothetical protein
VVVTLQSRPTSSTSAHSKPSRQSTYQQAQGGPADDPTPPPTPTSLLEERLGIWRALRLGQGNPIFDL